MAGNVPSVILCIDDLPEELVANITSYLPYSALALFSRTGKRYKRIANAYLYYTTDLYYITDENRCRGSIESIVANPELASNVRELQAAFSGRRGYQEIVLATNNTMRVWHTAVNVKRLKIYDYYSHLESPPWLESFNMAVSEAKAPLSNSFYHLTHLSISCGRVSLAEISSVFRLLSLLSLRLEWVPRNGLVGDWTVSKSSCNIQALELVNCNLDSAMLARIISCLRALRSFKYDHSRTPYTPNVDVSWPVVGDAIRMHNSSIRTLHLRSYREVGGEAGRFRRPSRGALGSLKDCHQLHEIHIPLHLLSGGHVLASDCLPSSLKSILVAVFPEDLAVMHCATAIESVKDVVLSGSDRYFQCRIPKGAPYGQLQLSGALQTLVDTGINVLPTLLIKDEAGRHVPLEDLRGMEKDGYEDDTSEDSDY